MQERVRRLDRASTEPYWTNFFDPATEFPADARRELQGRSRHRQLQEKVSAVQTEEAFLALLEEAATLEDLEFVMTAGYPLLKLSTVPDDAGIARAFETKLQSLLPRTPAGRVLAAFVRGTVYQYLGMNVPGGLGPRGETHFTRPGTLTAEDRYFVSETMLLT